MLIRINIQKVCCSLVLASLSLQSTAIAPCARFKSSSKVQWKEKARNDEISVSSDKRLMICGNFIWKPLRFSQHVYARAITCHVNCSRLRYVARVVQCEQALFARADRTDSHSKLGISAADSRLTGHWSSFGQDVIVIRDAYRAPHKTETFSCCVIK